MKNFSRHVGKLEIVRRLRPSRNGNPRYQCRCGGFTFVTEPDSSIAYELPHFEGKQVEIVVGTLRNKLTLKYIHTYRGY